MGESNSLIVIPAEARGEEMINLVAPTGPEMMIDDNEQAMEDENNFVQEKKDMHS